MAEGCGRADTILGLLGALARDTPGAHATFHRTPTGAWEPTSWSALLSQVEDTAAAFVRLGLRKRDRMGILARTCREWQVAELAGLAAGGVIVGVDAHASTEQVAWILEHAGVSHLVVDSRQNLAKIPSALREKLRLVLVLDGQRQSGEPATILGWQDLTAAASVSALRADQGPSSCDPATIVYTSGTTGTPKAIEYTHRQLMLGVHAIMAEFPEIGEGNRLLCWLPMAPLFQRMMNFAAFASRAVTYFAEDPREIMARVSEVRPTVFTSVPRFYEKLHDGVRERLATLSGPRRRLANAALLAGEQWSRCVRTDRRPGWGLRARHAIADRLILRRIREVMGGEIKWMISGSAPAPLWLLEFFHGIGFLVLEAYGLTENPVPLAANRPQAFRFGSVGKPFAMNDVRFGEDNEILVKGPALFTGYVGDERPEDHFTADGYYRTGDYGRLDDDGFLYLTGRKSEIIKTSTGRRISPTGIEGVYRQSPYVDQIVVVGNSRPHLVALVGINALAVEAVLKRGAIPVPPRAEWARTPAVIDLVNRELTAHGQRLASHERVRAFAILPEPLSVDTGELTTTLKPRRDRIESRYAGILDGLYAAARESAENVSTSASRHPDAATKPARP